MAQPMVLLPMDIRVRECDPELVRALRHIALDQAISLNSLVKKVLEEFVKNSQG